jgi:hypothetical protein
MQTWQVQLWPNGKWDGKLYQRVDADSAKEAAERLYGSPLVESGQMDKMRAQVRPLMPTGAIQQPTVFYEP